MAKAKILSKKRKKPAKVVKRRGTSAGDRVGVKAKAKAGVETSVHQVRIKVIGIGGGGASIVADIASPHKGTSFFIADTDRLALSKIGKKKHVKTFHFGEQITKGMGTGMNSQLGQQAAEQDRDRITKLLSGCDLCIFVGCLGGGVASGATPVFAEISKNLGTINYGIFTLPFDFERERKLKIAIQALEKIKPFFNTISIIPNQRIFKLIDRKAPLKKALATINQELSFNLDGLIKMIFKAGLINIDFADIKTILDSNKALIYLSRVSARGENRGDKILQALLQNPLYPYNIAKANKVLFNICGSSDISLFEVAQISKGISNAASKNCKVIFGVESIRGKKDVDVTLLAVGCETELFSLKTKKKKKKKKLKQTLKPKTTGDINDIKNSMEKKSRIEKKDVVEKNTSEKVLKNKKTSAKKEPSTKKKSPTKKKKVAKKKVIKKPNSQKTKSSSPKRIRKTGLQVQEEVKEIEKQLLEEEKKWERPSFLNTQNN